MIRKALLLFVTLETAALTLWYGWRITSLSDRRLWVLAVAWVSFIAVVALMSYNWRREEDSSPRGFEVLPNDKHEP